MYIDTHCHLNFGAFDQTVPEILECAKKAEVEKIIIPGTDLVSSQKAIDIANQYENCFAAIGIHPHHAKDETLLVNADLQEKLTLLAQQKKVVAIGEIGMDYFVYVKSKYAETEITQELREKQTALFRMQLEIALEQNLPVIFHCRDAFDDMITVIEECMGKKGSLRGVFHCFGGGKKDLRWVLEKNFFVGIDGNITYNQNLQFIPSMVPLNRLLLETDAPFLAPIPHREKQNEPSYLPLVASYVARKINTPVEKLADMTTQNAYSLFGLT